MTGSLRTVLPLLLLRGVSGLCIAAVLRGFVGSGKVNCKSIATFFFFKAATDLSQPVLVFTHLVW